jgi:TonB family protein
VTAEEARVKETLAASARVNAGGLQRQFAEAQKQFVEAQKQLAAAHAALAQESAPPPPPPPPTIVVDVPNPSSGIVRVSSGVMRALVLTQPPPIYPDIAKAAHVQGVVVLHAIISKEGKVEQLSVVSGSPMLQQSAIDAVQQWTYRPFLLNGQPVEVESTINVNYTFGGPITFSLVDQDEPVELTDAAGTPVRRIGGGISPPELAIQVAPEFTPEAKKAKFHGSVVVGCIIDEQGLPEDVHIVRGIGQGLNDKAIEAVKQYKFKPAMEDGKPVPVKLNIEVNFQLF